MFFDLPENVMRELWVYFIQFEESVPGLILGDH